MPYATNADLPEPVRKMYRDACQSVFRSTFNGVMKGTGKEASAMALAHTAAKKCMETSVPAGHIPTISDVLPAADWVEREIRDYYGIEFDGRAATPPLMLREGDVPGLFSRTSDLGTQIDPAETSRTNIASENGEAR